MSIYLRTIRPGTQPFHPRLGWDRGGQLPPNALVVRLSTWPPGKPPLEMLDKYESEWRSYATDVFSNLIHPADQSYAMFLWIQGPLLTGLLPAAFRYAFAEDDRGSMRYHFEGRSSLSRNGYYHHVICFEFSPEAFRDMMKDVCLDFEWMALQGLVLPETLVPDTFTRAPDEIVTPHWAVAQDAIAIGTHGYWDGCYLAGRETRVREALDRIDSAIGLVKTE